MSPEAWFGGKDRRQSIMSVPKPWLTDRGLTLAWVVRLLCAAAERELGSVGAVPDLDSGGRDASR